jgi:hypothetical protein
MICDCLTPFNRWFVPRICRNYSTYLSRLSVIICIGASPCKSVDVLYCHHLHRSVMWLSQRAVGESCQVAHPLVQSHVFDLSQLRANGSSVWNVPTATGNFTLNVCGPLPSFPALKDDCSASGTAAVCLHQDSGRINIGELNGVSSNCATAVTFS